MKNISSTGSFINFYLNNYIYVDKTKYIRDLIKLEEFLSPAHVVLVNLLP